MEQVPILDLAENDRNHLVHSLVDALLQFGFFYVRNHGIDEVLIQKQFQVAADLFDLPIEEKNAMPFNSDLDIGYVGTGVQTLNFDGTVQYSGDTKEQFMMTNNCLITSTKIPSGHSSKSVVIDADDIFQGSKNYTPDVPSHAAITKAYASAAYKLNLQLNDLLFDALSLDTPARVSLGSQPFCVLKQMKYSTEHSNPSEGKFGAGAHTDWGAFTILATDTTPGLEILFRDRWLPAPPQPGCLIINAGDQIASLTNHVYRSALHRVVTRSSHPRYSTAFFTYFNMDATFDVLPQFLNEGNNPDKAAISPPKNYTTMEYFHFRLHQSMGTLGQ